MDPYLTHRHACRGVALFVFFGLTACGQADAPDKTAAAPPPSAGPTATVSPPAAAKAIGVPKDYDCAGAAIEAIYFEHTATLRLDGETIRLDPVAVASGSRYQGWRADGVLVDFWEKGGTAMLNVAGSDYPECVLVETPVDTAAGVSTTTPPPGMQTESPVSNAVRTYTARGHEPFWLAQVDATEVRWNTVDHSSSDVFTDLSRTTREGGFEISAARDGATLALSSTDTICRSSMSGMPYPHTVTVRINGASYRGCGGDPLDLLLGREWTVSTLDGNAVGTPTPTLRFSADGRASGFAGCNRWMAGAVLTGERLAFERPAGTLMACPEAAMATEQAFLATLATVSRHDFDEAGALVLMSGDTAVIVATPGPGTD
ncbi:hypothetical protein GCM10028794_12230 [Silanimonas algicola]